MEPPKTGYIYKITNPKGKIYIGQTIDLHRRKQQYKNCQIKTQRILYNSIKKYGFDSHTFEVILECEYRELDKWERHYQILYETVGINGLNCIIQNYDGKGKSYISEETRQKKIKALQNRPPISEETREKIGASKRGDKNPNYNKPSKKRGIPLSDAQKEKLRQANMGKIASETTRKKMSENNKSKKRVYDTLTGITYNSKREAAISLGFKCIKVFTEAVRKKRKKYLRFVVLD